MDDEIYLDFVNYLSTGTLPKDFPSTKSNFIAQSKTFSLNRKNKLKRGELFVLKLSELDSTWAEIHQHAGRCKTYEKFKKRFWFRGMSVWVRKKTRECVPCSNKNNAEWPAQRAPLTPITVDPRLWWRVPVDLIGKLPTSSSGCKYIGLAVCALSKYVEAQGNIL